jgi:hypothetical protein
LRLGQHLFDRQMHGHPIQNEQAAYRGKHKGVRDGDGQQRPNDEQEND